MKRDDWQQAMENEAESVGDAVWAHETHEAALYMNPLSAFQTFLKAPLICLVVVLTASYFFTEAPVLTLLHAMGLGDKIADIIELSNAFQRGGGVMLLLTVWVGYFAWRGAPAIALALMGAGLSSGFFVAATWPWAAMSISHVWSVLGSFALTSVLLWVFAWALGCLRRNDARRLTQ